MNATALANLREERSSMIGGSDIAACFGFDYGCTRELVYAKRPDQYTPDHSFHGNRATDRGTWFEDVAAQLFRERYGFNIRRVAGGLSGVAKRNEDFPYIGCHSDRELVDCQQDLKDPNGQVVNSERTPGIVSIKNPGMMMFQKIKRTGLPRSWVLQLQYEMYIWKRQWGCYVIFWADGFDLLPFYIRRDDAMIAEILPRVHDVWRMVENGPLPERLDPSDARCQKCQFRTQCQGALLLAAAAEAKADQSQGVEVPYIASPELVELVEEYKTAQEIVDEAEANKDALKAQVVAGLILEGKPLTECDLDGFRLYHRWQDGRKTVQREPLVKYITDIARNAAEVAEALGKVPVAADHSVDAMPIITQALMVLGMVAEAPTTIAKKYINQGSPFQVLKVYAR